MSQNHLIKGQDSRGFSSVQSLSHVQLFATPLLATAASHASLSIVNSQNLLKFMRPSSRWWHPAISSSVVPFSSCLQSFPAAGSFLMSRLFSSCGQILELQHQSFQWIFRIDWLDLLAVQGTLKSLLQHHSWEASFLQCSAFFILPDQRLS